MSFATFAMPSGQKLTELQSISGVLPIRQLCTRRSDFDNPNILARASYLKAKDTVLILSGTNINHKDFGAALVYESLYNASPNAICPTCMILKACPISGVNVKRTQRSCKDWVWLLQILHRLLGVCGFPTCDDGCSVLQFSSSHSVTLNSGVKVLSFCYNITAGGTVIE